MALVIIAGGVLLMGQKTKMFTSKGKLQVVMDDVAGLKEGAPVWLAGVDVGVVTSISFVNPEKSNEVSILLEADHGALRRNWCRLADNYQDSWPDGREVCRHLSLAIIFDHAAKRVTRHIGDQAMMWYRRPAQHSIVSTPSLTALRREKARLGN